MGSKFPIPVPRNPDGTLKHPKPSAPACLPPEWGRVKGWDTETGNPFGPLEKRMRDLELRLASVERWQERQDYRTAGDDL